MLFHIGKMITLVVMSILEDYEKQTKLLGEKMIKAIDYYIEEMSARGKKIQYSEIIYSQQEFEKFKK